MNAEEIKDINSRSEDWSITDIKRHRDEQRLIVADFQRRGGVAAT